MSPPLDRLLAEGRDRWRRLDELLDVASKSPAWELGPERMREIVRLYRLAAADLNRLLASTADPDLIDPLNALVGRGYRFVYGSRRIEPYGGLRRLGRFFAHEIPAGFRGARKAVVVAALAFGVGALLGFCAVAMRPVLAEDLVPGEFFTASPRERVAEIEEKDERIATVAQAADFGSQLYTHNIRVSFLAFGMAAVTLVGGLWLLFWNGVILGAVAASYVLDGVGVFFVAWVGPHGALELPAIVFSGAAGLVLGRALWFPGEVTRGTALRAAFPTAWRMLIGTSASLVLAGLIEGSFSQMSAKSIPYPLKISVAVVLFVALFLFLFGRRAAPAGEAGEGEAV